MSNAKNTSASYDKVFAEQQEYKSKRASGYREQALNIYPWICGRCRREFTRRNLSELTVHHVDHNHGNNPTDGSNWELLCLYCHDEEHTKFENLVRYGSTEETEIKTSTYNPFADLKEQMTSKKQ
ncbi:YajD family HNH nuclease [Paraglaciecola sp. L3A3]|uniref:YajD family HNH nuclease n=1 Tax=Paraglaciecola sp. L3A3 TaxID=2686358 RepID=UPI00131DF0D6|nr:YajD family HNH nuclease [Paraglaciecola sp. L3A3]